MHDSFDVGVVGGGIIENAAKQLRFRRRRNRSSPIKTPSVLVSPVFLK